ncbi:MAG TPA: ABC transporter ATP-binding protein [Bacteroidota bacterium]|nr:ABC transporter ATP-binding protein [Bacteroidota bacterium]
MSEHAIEVTGLTKVFGSFTAVDHISFTVRRGEIFGFLGANGAGKSTTIRMLCGLLQPTSGTGRVGGFDIVSQTEQVKLNIGYMSQRFSLYDDLTVEQNIRFYGGIYGLGNHRLNERLAWVLKMADLRGRESSLTRTLSGGWKQRLALGCAILHQPQIVFLDEPTGGVDPISRRNFWELINRLSAEGITVLVTTHFLDEAEYCNDIILINAGRLIAAGSPVELKTRYISEPILEVSLLQEQVVDALELIRRRPWAHETSVFGTKLHVMVGAEEEGIRLIREALAEHAIVADRIERIVPSLEDVFLYLLDKEAAGSRPQEAAA